MPERRENMRERDRERESVCQRPWHRACVCQTDNPNPIILSVFQILSVLLLNWQSANSSTSAVALKNILCCICPFTTEGLQVRARGFRQWLLGYRKVSIVQVVWIQWIRFLPETWSLGLEQRARGVGAKCSNSRSPRSHVLLLFVCQSFWPLLCLVECWYPPFSTLLLETYYWRKHSP